MALMENSRLCRGSCAREGQRPWQGPRLRLERVGQGVRLFEAERPDKIAISMALRIARYYIHCVGFIGSHLATDKHVGKSLSLERGSEKKMCAGMALPVLSGWHAAAGSRFAPLARNGRVSPQT